MKKIVIYTTAVCPYCDNAKKLLDQKGLSYEEIYIDRDLALKEEMMTRSGRRTVPQIFVGETHVGGCDDLYALERTGKLDELLA